MSDESLPAHIRLMIPMSVFVFLVASAMAAVSVFAVKRPRTFDATFGLVFWAIQATFLAYLAWKLQVFGEFDQGIELLEQLAQRKYIRDERLNVTKWIIGLELFTAAYMTFLSRLSQKIARDEEIRRITG